MRVRPTRAWPWAALVTALACDHSAPLATEAAPLAELMQDTPMTAGNVRDVAEPMVGVLVPQAEILMVSTGFARLVRLDPVIGDHVDAGEVVAEMDVRGDRSDLSAATAAWKASATELERLELELERARAVRADVEQLESYVSQAELREQRYAEKLADARKRSAGASVWEQRSRMEEATARIADAELRAPFAGVIASRFADAGATLAAGEPVVRLISDVRLVRFAVPEPRSDGLQLGARVFVAFPEGAEIAGEVVTIAPEIEVGTRLIFAEARLQPDGAAASLRIGTVARVRFATPP